MGQSVPVLDNARSFSNAHIKRYQFFVLPHQRPDQKIVPLEGQSSQINTLAVSGVLSVLVAELLKIFSGLEVQPELNEQHQNELFYGRECSELFDGVGDGRVLADYGNLQDCGDEQTQKLKDVEQSKVNSFVDKYCGVIAAFGEYSKIYEEKSHHQQDHSQVATDTGQQYKDKQRHE